MPDDYVHEDQGITEEDISGPEINRRTTIKLLSVAGLGGLAGCLGDDDDTDDADPGGDDDADGQDISNIQTGGTLTAAWNVNQLEQLDPHYSELTFATHIIGNFFSGLLEITEDLTTQGDLAEDWTVEDGGETITFDLVENASFHNGDSFTAEDVRYSIERVLTEDTSHDDKLQSLEPVDDGGVVVVDEYTVELNFEEAFAPILIFLTSDIGNAGAVVSQRAIEEMGDQEYGITPVGTGPFSIERHNLGSTLVAEAHEGYHKTDADGNPLPYLDGLEVEPVQEAQTRTTAITTGEVDFVNWVEPAQVEPVEQSDQVILEAALGPNFGGIAFNNQAEPFDSRNARLAVAKAIDRERYVEETLFGHGVPDTGLYSPAHDWVFREIDEKPDTQQYDPEEARTLAEEEGILGIEIEMMVSEPELRGARILQNLLAEELDWDVELNQFDIPTIFQRLQESNYKFIPFGNSAAPDPDALTYQMFGPPDETLNWWGPYENDELRPLLVEQRRQLDQDERRGTLHEIEDILINEAPWAFMEHQEILSGRQPYVQGYHHFGVIHRFRDVWLDE